MDRMELIARLAGKRAVVLGKKPPGMSVAAGNTPVTRKRRGSPPTGKEWRLGFGPGLGWRSKKWVHEGDDRKAKVMGERRRRGKHWLTRVAERLKRR